MLHPVYSYPGDSAPSRGDTAMCLVSFHSASRAVVSAGAWGASLHYLDITLTSFQLGYI